MQHHIEMGGLTSKAFVANSRHPGQSYKASIQNNTAQLLTITVTNQNILNDSAAVYSPLPVAALTVAAGAMGIIDEPYVGWLLTLALAGVEGETIDIVEAG